MRYDLRVPEVVVCLSTAAATPRASRGICSRSVPSILVVDCAATLIKAGAIEVLPLGETVVVEHYPLPIGSLIGLEVLEVVSLLLLHRRGALVVYLTQLAIEYPVDNLVVYSSYEMFKNPYKWSCSRTC